MNTPTERRTQLAPVCVLTAVTPGVAIAVAGWVHNLFPWLAAGSLAVLGAVALPGVTVLRHSGGARTAMQGA